MLRSLLEKWSRGIVLKRHLPAEFGRRTIFVSPEGGGLRYWKPRLSSIDPMLAQVVRQFIRPGQTIWDVGGNLGFFTLMAANQAGPTGRVAVFEPDLFLTYLLRKTTNANPDRIIDIFPTAVSNQNGIAKFNIAARSRSTNFLVEAEGSTQTGGIRQTISVPTISLDTFLTVYPAPDFIKIDVEGAEHLVLEGMENILTTCRPTILCEVSSHNYSTITKKLQTVGYNILDTRHLPEHVVTLEHVENILAIPSPNPL